MFYSADNKAGLFHVFADKLKKLAHALFIGNVFFAIILIDKVGVCVY